MVEGEGSSKEVDGAESSEGPVAKKPRKSAGAPKCVVNPVGWGRHGS